MISIRNIISDTDLTKLTSLSKEDIIDFEVKVNGKRVSPNTLEKLSSMSKAILDMILDYIQSKDVSILGKEIILQYNPTELDKDLDIKVGIPEYMKNKYQVSFAGDMLYIYDFFENMTISVSFKKSSYKYVKK